MTVPAIHPISASRLYRVAAGREPARHLPAHERLRARVHHGVDHAERVHAGLVDEDTEDAYRTLDEAVRYLDVSSADRDDAAAPSAR